jgi:ketosteroid isomerase-like protein
MTHGSARRWLVLGSLVLLFSGAAALGQRKEQKGKKNEPLVPLPDEQVINNGISEMLAAWQIGDTELLHKHYADDVMVVSGAWEPPLMGWERYLQAYRSQRERMQNASLDRVNTYVTAKGNIAWAVYQWQFFALVDGKPTAARGHTTLILEKRNARWLIVHNHTSVVPEVREPAPAPPAKPGA